MSEHRYQQGESEQQSQQENYQPSEAAKVASQMSTRQYFLSQQARLLDQWGQQSLELFDFTTEVFKSQYQLRASNMTQQYSKDYQDLYAKCRKQFEAYCLLNRKVQKKSDQIQNIAQHFNKKNHKKNFFNAWKSYSQHQAYLRRMQQKSEKYYQDYRMRSSLKSWLGITMKNNRLKIKNQVLHKTEIQISKIQNQYERLIKGLEQTLEKRLSELKKQQEEHRLLHSKYEAMYSRSKVNEVQI